MVATRREHSKGRRRRRQRWGQRTMVNITVQSREFQIGVPTSVVIIGDSFPLGLAGFDMDFILPDPHQAIIQEAVIPLGLGVPAISRDGASVSLRAADILSAVQPGATNVTLATMTILGRNPASIAGTVVVNVMDDDAGDPITVDSTDGGTLDVKYDQRHLQQHVVATQNDNQGNASILSDATVVFDTIAAGVSLQRYENVADDLRVAPDAQRLRLAALMDELEVSISRPADVQRALEGDPVGI